MYACQLLDKTVIIFTV